MKKTLLVLVFFSLFLTKSFSQTINLNSFIENVNLDSLTYSVKELSGVVDILYNGNITKIVSRHKNNADNNKAADYIYQKLSGYNLEVTKQVFSSTGYNVYGTKQGTKYPNKKVIICGHFDSMPSGAKAPGADDNGSGTAAVIEAARILQDVTTPFTMVFALWDEEEQGLIGSEYYAAKAASEGDTIIAVINMDMIAWNRSNSNRIELHTDNTLGSNNIVDKMVELNTQLNLGFNTAIINPGATYSDHASFWDHNYPAVLVIEEDNDFNAYYHTIGDTLGNFNFSYFHRASKLSIATFLSYALNLNIVLEHNTIASTDQNQEIKAELKVNSGLPIDIPVLYFRVDEGNGAGDFTKLSGTKTGDDGNYIFNFPALPLGSLVEYYIAVQDSAATIISSLPSGAKGFSPAGNIPPAKLYSFYCAPETELFADSFKNVDKWNLAGSSGLTQVQFVSSPYSITDSPIGNYTSNNTSSFATKTNIKIPESLGAILTFKTNWDIESGWDYAMCQVSTDNGINWIPLEGNYTKLGSGSFQPKNKPLYDGKSNGWVKENINLNDYKGKDILVRFYFRSDGYENFDGFYVDDLKLVAYEKPTGVENNEITQYLNFELFANYPNPFNPTTTISYQIPVDGVVKLKVFDVLGREVTTLVDEYKNRGKYNVNFEARNLAGGVYIYQIKMGDFIKANKMILIK